MKTIEEILCTEPAIRKPARYEGRHQVPAERPCRTSVESHRISATNRCGGRFEVDQQRPCGGRFSLHVEQRFLVSEIPLTITVRFDEANSPD